MEPAIRQVLDREARRRAATMSPEEIEAEAVQLERMAAARAAGAFR